MTIEIKLNNLGLNTYEAKALIYIFKNNIVEASEIYKQTKIPYGKIYETLNSLIKLNFIEVQNSRPKKYKCKNLKLALNSFMIEKKNNFNQFILNQENELASLLNEIDNIVIKKDNKDKKFWRTAMDKEIPSMIISTFQDAKSEIKMMFYEDSTKHNHNMSSKSEFELLLDEIIKSIKRGIKIKLLVDSVSGDTHLKYFKEMFDENTLKNISVRISEKPFHAYYTLIDSEEVVFSILEPINKNSIIAMTKIIDSRLNNKLSNEFNILWDKSKKRL